VQASKVIRRIFPLVGIAFTAWLVWGYQSVDVPDDTLTTTDAVQVTDTPEAIEFKPLAGRKRTGVLFLPGGMVDPLAYTPLMKKLAAAGHPTYLVRLPYRTAFTDSHITELFQTVRTILEKNRDTRWYLTGHSRGAMLATRFARESQTNLTGLILIGTTHPRDFDLSASTLKITKITGSHDGIATTEAAKANAHLLPRSTMWLEIPGANHVQFGYYRHQLLDGLPDITREQQQAALLKAIRLAL